MKIIINHRGCGGFVALLLVLSLGAFLLTAGLGVAGLGLNRLLAATTAAAGDRIARAADGCLSLALLGLRRDSEFAVATPVTIVQPSLPTCIIRVMKLDSTNRGIEVFALEGEYRQRLWSKATVGPRSVELIDWRRGN